MRANKRRQSVRTKADRMVEREQLNQSMSQEEEKTYEVEAILKKDVRKGVEYYLVSWKGYPRSQATWEPKQNMTDCSSLILEYQLTHLPQQEREQLITETDTPFKPSSDPLPPTLYEHNFNAICPYATLASCGQQISFLITKAEQWNTLGPEEEVIQILNCEQQRGEKAPIWFGVKLKSGDVKKVRKEEVLKAHRLKLVEYYEQLIIWSS